MPNSEERIKLFFLKDFNRIRSCNKKREKGNWRNRLYFNIDSDDGGKFDVNLQDVDFEIETGTENETTNLVFATDDKKYEPSLEDAKIEELENWRNFDPHTKVDNLGQETSTRWLYS